MAETRQPLAGSAPRPAFLSGGSAMTFVVLLGTVGLFSDMTYEGGRSIAGQFLKVLGSSAVAVGIAAGAGEFLGYALRFASGFAADRTGAYWPIVLAGYSIQLLALPALAFVGRWDLAVGLMFAERIGKAIRNPARDAMLSYATHEMGRGWGYGLHEAMDQIGGLLGPSLMGLVLLWRGVSGQDDLRTYQAAFMVLFIPAVCAIAALLVARSLFPHPRDLESKTPRASAEGLGRRYWLYVLAASLVGAGFADFALVAFHLKTTALVPDAWIPLLCAFGVAVDVVVALVAGRMYDRRGFATLLLTFGASALFAPFVFLGSLPMVLIGLAMWGIGLAAQESILRAALANVIPAHRRAYGFGLFALVFGVFWFAGSALMGLLYDYNVTYLALFSVAAELLALPIFMLAELSPAAASD